MKKIFSKSAEIFRWGPIPGKFFYISDFWNVIFIEYARKYPNYCWPKTLAIFKAGRMVWINDFNELRKMGGEVFLKFMLPIAKRIKLRLDWYKDVDRLSKIENKIDSINLRELSDSQLFKLGNELLKRINAFWMLTTFFEMGNYGSSEILEVEIKKVIKDDNKILKVMEVLCAPEQLSFYQEEELDLLKTKNIKKHLNKYFWLKNSYGGIEVLGEEFFKKRRQEISKNLEKNLKEKIISIKENKSNLIKEYKFNSKIINLSKALIEGIKLQDERKKYILISLYYKDLFLKEIVRRKNVDADDLYNLDFKEVLGIISGEKSDYLSIIKNRSNSFGFFAIPHRPVVEINHKDSVQYWDKYALEKVNNNNGSVKGIIASSGSNKITRAKVKILLNPSNSEKFKKEEILVAPMTSPEYIFAMKKASAVITDSGGLTSHAAIVTRELNKPCLVGTKYATQVFKDGDMVEVDTNKGIARIIK